MDGFSLLKVIALVLIFESIIPFISPRSYKHYLEQISNTPDNKIQLIALVVLLTGAVIWFIS